MGILQESKKWDKLYNLTIWIIVSVVIIFGSIFPVINNFSQINERTLKQDNNVLLGGGLLIDQSQTDENGMLKAT